MRSLAYAILKFVSVMMLLVLASCADGEKIKPAPGGLTDEDDPSQISYDVTLSFSNEGHTKAILTTQRIRSYEAKHKTVLDSGVRIDFFDAEGKHSTRLTAARGFVDDQTKNMTAYDSVHVVSDSGTVVDTDSLVWDNRTQKLHSDAPVKILEKSGRVTTGLGFESDQNLTNYHILRPTIVSPTDEWQNPQSSRSPSAQPPASDFAIPTLPGKVDKSK